MKMVIRKFDGDYSYSWAVFRKEDLPKGHRGIVFFGEATPIINGCTRSNAKYHADCLSERKDKK